MKTNVKCKSIQISSPLDISKMHGHMDIYLTDVKTGKVEEVHEDNMMTNALQEYFRNCGFLNYPDVNQNSLVTELLGGVMGFSEEISENASIVNVPAGNKMIFNGSVGTLNNGNPTEMGSYSETESGWQQDGSYVQTYDFSTSQANGTISCVCLTSRTYGYIGEGNSTSLAIRSAKQAYNNMGNITPYTVSGGEVFRVDMNDSSCCVLAIEQHEEEQGGETVLVKETFVRKYRLPISKLNIKGTQAEPVLLSERRVTGLDNDSDFQSCQYFSSQPLKNGNIVLWNVQLNFSKKWGTDWTQYVWEIQPNGTVTKSTIINTSGNADLKGLQVAIFDGNYCFFVDTTGLRTLDSNTIYILNRSTGVITSIDNPYGAQTSDYGGWSYDYRRLKFSFIHGTGTGRIVVGGANTTSGQGVTVIDAVLGEAYPTNGANSPTQKFSYVTDLIKLYNGNSSVNLYRLTNYIASINNLDNPVVKTSEKTMKVIYRITFDE